MLGKNQAIGVVHIFELSNLFLSFNNVSWKLFPIHDLTCRAFTDVALAGVGNVAGDMIGFNVSLYVCQLAFFST